MEAGLSTRGAEKPAGLVISAVEVNPCIRASPRIPIVHAGPALGLQGPIPSIGQLQYHFFYLQVNLFLNLMASVACVSY